MNADSYKVKAQYEEDVNYWKLNIMGPFKIGTGQTGIKPIYKTSTGKWTNFQNAKYAAYILFNKALIEHKSPQRLWQVYKDMSSFIGTRNFRQCKSQHQKLRQMSPSINGIISYLQASIYNFDSLLSIQTKSYQIFSAKSHSQQTLNSQPKISISETILQKNVELLKKNQQKTSASYYTQSSKILKTSFIQPTFSSKFKLHEPKEQIKTIEQQWLECHQLFFEWMMKLQELSEFMPT